MPPKVGGLATAVAVGMIPEFIYFRKFKVVVIIWLASECVGDVVITTSLVWHLVCLLRALRCSTLICSYRKGTRRGSGKPTIWSIELLQVRLSAQQPLPFLNPSSYISDGANGHDHVALRYNRFDSLSR